MQHQDSISGAAVVVPLTSGIAVEVTTLTPLVMQRIVVRSEELYPLPDKKPYEKPKPGALPDTNAVIPAEENPEYAAAVRDVYETRMEWVLIAVLRAAVRAANPEAIIAYYADSVGELRDMGALVEHAQDTPFTVVLRNCLASNEDMNTILQVAQMKAPLSAPEVADGRALFQLDARPKADRASALRRIAPRVERASKGQTESPLNGNRDGVEMGVSTGHDGAVG